jgi:hypothetical protein
MAVIPRTVRHKLATYKKYNWKRKDREQCPLRGCNGIPQRVKFSQRKYQCPECETHFKGNFLPYLKVIEVE